MKRLSAQDDNNTQTTNAVFVAPVLGTPASGVMTNVTGLPTAGLVDDAVTDAKLVYGKVRGRQGGSSTVWATKGTTNYDVSATNTFTQTGSIGLSTEGTNVVVTFPVAFTYAPVVVVSTASAVSANVASQITAITATTFNVRAILGNGSAETCTWIAIGQ